MKARALRAAFALCASAVLSGCVTVQEFQVLRRDVDRLKGGQTGSSSAATSDEWSAGASTSGAGAADLRTEVESLRDDVSRLRGELDEVKRQLELAKTELQSRPGEASGATAPTPTEGGGTPGENAATGAPAPSAGGPPPVATTAPTGSAQETRDYTDAFKCYQSQDFPCAVDRFQAFLQTHPSSDYADNALFWMGESYFKLSDFEQAAVTFDKVVKRFPNGNKVPDALYRQGVSLVEIGKKNHQEKTYNAAAKQIFKRIVDQYPTSERVPETRRQLEKLGT